MLYTTSQLAHEGGVTVRTARRVLRDCFPNHEPRTWWRIPESEYGFVLEQLRAAQRARPEQPRRVLPRDGFSGF